MSFVKGLTINQDLYQGQKIISVKVKENEYGFIVADGKTYVNAVIGLGWNETVEKYNAKIWNGDKLCGWLEDMTDTTVTLSKLTKVGSNEAITVIIELKDVERLYTTLPNELRSTIIWEQKEN